MAITIGTQLGSHEITALLGRGGMGEVYRARDTKLKREVAIKILSEEFSRDADRVSRFQREAEVLASLNHPNIAMIYDLEEANDTRFLVLELVEGETLAQRIQRGPTRVQEALDIAKHICEALEAAHEKGIVHRDLKPANVKMTPDGKVKILDFGLAKAMEAGPPTMLSNSPTLSQMATNAGVILGTAAYMSPEQARGENADSRSDIFSFGCLLYEMLSGRQSFQGKTVSDVLASVLAREPDLTVLPAKLNPRIPQLIRRALEKAAKQRWQAIGDVRAELEAIMAEGAIREVERSQPRPLWKRAIPAVIASAVFGLITGFIGWYVRPSTPAIIARFPIILPEGQQFTNTGRLALAISPDGTQFVYVANTRLHLRSMSDLEPKAIPGTEGANVNSPAFSPDGRSIAFWVGEGRGVNGFIKKIAVAGGAPVTICPATNPYGLNWGQDGMILFGQGPDGIMRVSANGGKPETLISVKDNELAHQPQMLPGGEAVLFTLAALSGEDLKDRWDKARVVVQSLKTGERKILVDGGSDARYIPTGHLVYALGRTLFAVPFDVRRLAAGIGATPVIEGIRRFDDPNLTGVAHFSFSNSGSLIYIPGPAGDETVGLQRSLVFMDRKGGVKAIGIPPGAYSSPRVSPDGKRIAFSTNDGKDEIIWIYDLSGTGSVRRLTFEGSNRSPIWSPDSQRVAYSSTRRDGASILWQRADGSDVAEPLMKAEAGTTPIPEAWSPLGQTLAFSLYKPNNIFSLWILSREDKKPLPFAQTGKYIARGTFSANGHWIAYQSDETGQPEIFVQPFPPTGTKYQISKGGGRHPVWSPDGRELFFNASSGVGVGKLSVVEIVTQPGFTFGNPAPIPLDGILDGIAISGRNYDITPDGKYFIVVIPASQTQTGRANLQQVQVVLNWFEELKQRVPVR